MVGHVIGHGERMAPGVHCAWVSDRCECVSHDSIHVVSLSGSIQAHSYAVPLECHAEGHRLQL